MGENRAEFRRAIRLTEQDRVRADSDRRAVILKLQAGDPESWRLDAIEAELAALDGAIEALHEHRLEMSAEMDESIVDALADISADRADIVDDHDIDEDERRLALADLDAAREQLNRQRARQSELTKAQLDEMDKEIARLKARRAAILNGARNTQ